MGPPLEHNYFECSIQDTCNDNNFASNKFPTAPAGQYHEKINIISEKERL